MADIGLELLRIVAAEGGSMKVFLSIAIYLAGLMFSFGQTSTGAAGSANTAPTATFPPQRSPVQSPGSTIQPGGPISGSSGVIQDVAPGGPVSATGSRPAGTLNQPTTA